MIPTLSSTPEILEAYLRGKLTNRNAIVILFDRLLSLETALAKKGIIITKPSTDKINDQSTESKN